MIAKRACVESKALIKAFPLVCRHQADHNRLIIHNIPLDVLQKLINKLRADMLSLALRADDHIGNEIGVASVTDDSRHANRLPVLSCNQFIERIGQCLLCSLVFYGDPIDGASKIIVLLHRNLI